MKSFRLSEIANYVAGTLYGEDLIVKGFNALNLATGDDLSFIDSAKRLNMALTSQARALIAPLGLASQIPQKSIIEVPDVRVAIAKVSLLFREAPSLSPGVSPTAYVEPSAQIDPEAIILPFAYIGRGAKIGKRALIYPFCYVGDFCEVGEESVLFPHVVLYPGTIVGKRCIIHAGVVLGADGFGYAQEKEGEGFRNLKIYHFGNVRLEEDVEIGANSTVDRATFGETLIGAGTKIDNLVQVGHNVKIGKECILVSHTAIGGSAILEDYVMLAGQVGVAPQSKIRKGAKVAAKSGVTGEIPEGAEVAGIPAIKASIWRRAVIIFEKLPELYKEWKKLVKL